MIYVGDIAINPEHVISVYPLTPGTQETGYGFQICCRDQTSIRVSESNCGIVRGEDEPKEGPERKRLKESRRQIVQKIHDDFIETLTNVRMLT